MSDEDADLCLCGHTEDEHDFDLGYCTARACRCVVFRTEDELKDELDDELNFDHGQ
jgi:hypothetical protein